MSELQYDHWTRDESLLEEYVLGRIGPPRREQLEEHLSACDECRGVVAKEQRLAAGVRRAGREAMKQRLDQRLIQRTHIEIGWYRTAGIAAGIVLLITIGIYGKWFFGGEESATASREIVDQVEKKVEPAPEILPQEISPAPKKTEADAVRRLAEAESPSTPIATEGAGRTEEAGRKKVDEAQAYNFADSKKERADAPPGGAEPRDKLAAAASLAVPETWILGTVISSQERERAQVLSLAADANETKQISKKGKLEQKQAAPTAGVMETSAPETQNIRVQQQLRSNLPASQRAQQRAGRSIETLLNKTATGLTMTLFLDSLVAGKDLERANIQAIGEDSIILNIGDRRIGYRLPSELNVQGGQQKSKLK